MSQSPPSRRAEQREQIRQQPVDSALQLASAHGVDSVSLPVIGNAPGLSRGTARCYPGSKIEIWQQAAGLLCGDTDMPGRRAGL